MAYQVLIDTLLEEGNRKSDEMVENGRRESEAIFQEAKAKADRFEMEKRKEFQKKILFARTRILNEAHLEGRRIILEAKHEILKRLFELAEERFRAWLNDSSGEERRRAFWKRRVEEALQERPGASFIAFLPEDGPKGLEAVLNEKGISAEKVCDPELTCGFKLVVVEEKAAIINSYLSRIEKIRADLIVELQGLLFNKNG